MPIIDFHTHTFPDALAARAIPALATEAGIPAYTDGTNAGLRASMLRAGIDRACIMPIATKPAQARAINQWAWEVNGTCDDLICFGTLHPEQLDWEEEIAYIVAHGLRGVKFHPDYQRFFVDEPRMLPIYHRLADAGLIVLFHAGVDIGLPPPVHGPPDRLARILDAVPCLTVVAAHMGGYRQWDQVRAHLIGRDLYFDTSYSLTDLGAEGMVDLITRHGADRILFATDSPWADQLAEARAFDALPIPNEAMAAIMGGNAARLLG